MAKAKTPAAKRNPREKNRKDRSKKAGAPERPPESAEDFAHVLRRLVATRTERPDKV